MKPIDFAISNKTLSKPDGWTEEEYGPLPVHSDGERCLSLWKGTWQEQFYFLWTGKLWLNVHSGNTQPPVSIAIERGRTK